MPTWPPAVIKVKCHPDKADPPAAPRLHALLLSLTQFNAAVDSGAVPSWNLYGL